jgi:hypothetical protein
VSPCPDANFPPTPPRGSLPPLAASACTCSPGLYTHCGGHWGRHFPSLAGRGCDASSQVSDTHVPLLCPVALLGGSRLPPLLSSQGQGGAWAARARPSSGNWPRPGATSPTPPSTLWSFPFLRQAKNTPDRNSASLKQVTRD